MKIGTNLAPLIFGNAVSQPFINVLKNSLDWSAPGNISGTWGLTSMNVDGNGYPLNFNCKVGGPAALAGNTVFNIFGSNNIAVYLLRGQPAAAGFYQSGIYVFQYSGGGGTEAFNFGNDGSVVFSNAGRIGIQVTTPSANGVKLTISNLGSRTINNFSFVYSPDSTSSHIGVNEAAFNAGAVFNPAWVSIDGFYKSLRFMDWFNTNGNTWVNWSERILPTYVFWPVAPYEVAIAACNKLNADGWFNIPQMATDDFVTQFATLVHQGNSGAPVGLQSGLNSPLKCFTEWGNEIWFTGWPFMSTLGYQAYPLAQNYFANFTGFIDDGSSGSSYSGIAGTVLHASSVTANNSTPGISYDPNNHAATVFGSGVATNTRVQSAGTGTGLAGTYNVLPSQAVPPTAMTQGSDFTAGFQYGIKRQVESNIIWRNVWLGYADSARHTRVLAGQAGGYGVGGRNDYIMKALPTDLGGSASTWTNAVISAGTNAYNKYFDVFAIAPYWDYNNSNFADVATLFAYADANLIPNCYTEITQGALQCAGTGQGIPMVSYEGGQQFGGGFQVQFDAQIDAGMGTRYTTLLNHWLAAGGDVFHHYNDIELTSGTWGATRSPLITTDPKYLALKNFISGVSPGGRPVFLTKL